MRDSVSVRSRLIGASLREYREQAGRTIADAAQLLDCDRSKISRIETGTRGISPEELRKLLDDYAADPGGYEALDALATAGATRGWWDDFRALLTPGYRDIMATEHAATHIAIYAPVGIPELLHAEDYARALAAAGSGTMSAAAQARAVAATLARQRAILIARPTEVTVIVAATALRQKAGETAVMRGQMHYLAELAAVHPRVTIQLLPLTASLHAAGGSGTFSILRFSHDPAPMLVLAGGPGGGTVLDNQDSVAAYDLALARLRSLALTPYESARWLRRMTGAKGGRLPLR
jgi:transcriptional regulator with XRE-family HTH domain